MNIITADQTADSTNTAKTLRQEGVDTRIKMNVPEKSVNAKEDQTNGEDLELYKIGKQYQDPAQEPEDSAMDNKMFRMLCEKIDK